MKLNEFIENEMNEFLSIYNKLFSKEEMEEFIIGFLNKRNPNLGNGKRVKMKDEKM